MNVSDVPRSLQSWVSTIHTVVLTADVFQLLRTGTSWAGQEALSGTISQYHAQFLEFEPDILTRDLKQAQQHIESRMQKNKRQIVLLWPAQSFCWSLRWGKVHRFFLFFCIRLPPFFWAWFKSRVKISGPKSKISARHSKNSHFLTLLQVYTGYLRGYNSC